MWMEYHMCLDLQYRAPLFHVNPRKFLPQPQTEQMLKNEGNSLKKKQQHLERKDRWASCSLGVENRIVFSLYKPQFLTDSLKQMRLSEETEIQHWSFPHHLQWVRCSLALSAWSRDAVTWRLSPSSTPNITILYMRESAFRFFHFNKIQKLPSCDDDRSLQYPKLENAAGCIFYIENDDISTHCVLCVLHVYMQNISSKFSLWSDSFEL